MSEGIVYHDGDGNVVSAAQYHALMVATCHERIAAFSRWTLKGRGARRRWKQHLAYHEALLRKV